MTAFNESVTFPHPYFQTDPSDSIMNGSFMYPTAYTGHVLSEEEALDKLKIISINQPWIEILTTLYLLLIVMGSVGNSLVVVIVIRRPIMRTARNIFILNLAISGKG